MLHKTRGIVLHSVTFSETSLVVKLYTEAFGLQSYMVKGAKGKKSSFRPVFFQPLNLLETVVYKNEKSALQSMKEVQLALPFRSIPFDIRKSSIALFLNEILYKSIREEEPNAPLFDFLWNAITFLDETSDPFLSFHVVFLMKLTRFLGFYPHEGQGGLFNLKEGRYQTEESPVEELLNPSLSSNWLALMNCPLERVGSLELTSNDRNALLVQLLAYYRHHLPGMREIRSHEVLHTVLS